MGEALDFSSWPAPRRIILGRPVHFSNPPDAELDRFAAERLLAAIRLAGFEEIVFEFEPIAAAYAYEARLDRDERILIGDFGGGTSDFTIISVGTRRPRARTPGVRHHRHRWRGDCGRRVRQADHQKPGGAAARAGRRVPVAARQVSAGAELAVRTARALALPVVPEVAADARDAGAHSANGVDAGAAPGVPAADQARARLPAARGGAADQVRAVDRDGVGVHIRVGAGDHPQEGDARRLRALDRATSWRRSPAASIG